MPLAEKYRVLPDWDAYGVSLETGFLPPASLPPSRRIAHAYYAPWEDLVSDMQALLLAGVYRQRVQELPLLTTDLLHGCQDQLERACVVLSFLAHGYVWGKEQAAEEVLPEQLAVPWVDVSQRLGLFPVLTYATTVLFNYRLLDPSRGVALDNVASNTLFTGASDEAWFYLISLAIEARGGPAAGFAQKVYAAMDADDCAAAASALAQLALLIRELTQELNRMYEHCDAHVFFNHLRHYLAGWENMGDPLPNGVFYEGCPADRFPVGSDSELEDADADAAAAEAARHALNSAPERRGAFTVHPETGKLGTFRRYAGGSAGQSALIHFLDSFLGVKHGSRHDTLESGSRPREKLAGIADNAPDTAAPASEPNLVHARHHGHRQHSSHAARAQAAPSGRPKTNFVYEMRRYMPRKHRQLLRIVRRHRLQVRDYVAAHTGNPHAAELVVAYNACVDGMHEFRSQHIRMVSLYIVVQAAAHRRRRETHAPASSDAESVASDSVPERPFQSSDSAKLALLARGTGGTDVIPLLKSLRHDTSVASIK